MNQEKVGKFILELRKKNNLTQKELADKLGVTYQAVSKWETGKNIPDISIIKMICEEYKIDINEILDVKTTTKNDNKTLRIIVLSIFVLILAIIFITQFNYSKDKNFEFKTIEANCDNFNISGSIAYNDNKSSIYISSVEYCGATDSNKYKKIECGLYHVENNKSVKIEDCGYDVEKPTTLDDYLKNVKFNIDEYSSICSDYPDNSLQLEISATDSNDRTTIYKVPLKFNSNCKK